MKKKSNRIKSSEHHFIVDIGIWFYVKPAINLPINYLITDASWIILQQFYLLKLMGDQK